MNRQSKSTIKSLVLTVRHKLEDDVGIQLKRYGFAGERWLPLERLSHIQQDDQATVDHFRLKTALEQHLRRIDAAPEKATPQQRTEAVDWFVREVTFTHLNRLAALKCLEVRRLIPEIITTRDAYGGRSHAHYDYRNAHPDEGRQPDDALPAAIRCVCRQVYAEFKFLFDVGDPATSRPPPANSILWPSYPVLKECIGLINRLDAMAGNHDRTLWAEDEIIGWIYQFYNAEQKEAIRKRGRPRCPAEVAVINQFFTPRWIVKFLVDNTLGRLWLEMHPDSERVRVKCDYLVSEPLPAEETGERGAAERGAQGETDFRLDPDSPINDPKAPPRRQPKRPQDIRLIDPACGTMHFGHYAFEVFQEIYRDAHDHGWVTGDDALPDEEIPVAILRHNLYGVDIDLRAVQLAGLSLYIKAKTANPKAHISHVNLVVADAVLPADSARQEFLQRYKDDKVVQEAVRQVLEEMANVAEVGSLLRVEERLREILAKAGHAAVQDWEKDRQRELPGLEPPVHQLSLAETAAAIPEEWGAHYTLARLLEDLRAFASEALQTHDLNAQLFAQEAEKTIHLLDVFLNDYDVVVMNPPYGNTMRTARSYLKRAFPFTSNDLYAAFFERALDLAPEGYVGALTSRTFMYHSTFQNLREQVLLNEAYLTTVLDLGFGVLDDALVETSATVVGAQRHLDDPTSLFIRLTGYDERQKVFDRVVQGGFRDTTVVFSVPTKYLGVLPKSRFAYWASEDLLRHFEELQPFQPTLGVVKTGLQTSDDVRFIRHVWEVAQDQVGRGEKWVPLAKGGSYCKYYYDLDLVVEWAEGGRSIKEFPKSVIRNEESYFREGLSYPLTTVKGFNVRCLPEHSIIGIKGPGIYFSSEGALWYGLGFLNSKLVQAYLLMQTTSRDFTTGLVTALPAVSPKKQVKEFIAQAANLAFRLKAAWDTGNEICTRFDAPSLIQAHWGALLPDFADLHPATQPTDQLTSMLDYVRAVEQAADARLQQIQVQIDQGVYDLYEIRPEDRVLIERELGDGPPELVWPQMEGKSDKEKRREHVRRLVSFFLLQALKEKRDGILPLTPGTGQATALEGVRRRMEAEFGEEAAFSIETEIKQLLGKSIPDWLNGPFFKWHTKLYKRRPIIWHLASPGNTFACLVYYHELDRDALHKVQTQYLWPRRRAAQAELEMAKADRAAGRSGAVRRIEQAEANLDDLAEFEKRLLSVIQAQVECDTPDWADGPFQGGVYNPVQDDGVKVNITPLQEAGLLRHKKVV